MASVTLTGIVGVVLVLGLAITAVGAGILGQWLRLYRRSPVDAHEIGDGPIEFVGTATSLEAYGTVRSGLTGERCLLYEYELEEAEQTQHGESWNEVVSGSDAVPFVIGDETGRVLADPNGATTILEREFDERLEPGDGPSGDVATFLARSEVDRTHGTIDIGITEITYGDDQRFRERRIHEGETVYVAGVADRRVGDYDIGFGGPDAVVRAREDRGRLRRFFDDPFVLSDRSESAAEWYLLERSLAVLAIGVATSVLAGYLLATVLG